MPMRRKHSSADEPCQQFQTKCELSQMAGLTEHFTNISRAKSGKMVTMMTMPLVSLIDQKRSMMLKTATILTGISKHLRRKSSMPG